MNKVGLSIVMLAVCAGCATSLVSNDGAVIQAKRKVIPALVHIRPVKEVFAGGKREEVVVSGSGFIISPDGYVVTNEHVAGESDSVRCVLSNKEEVEAEVVGTDRFTDIAVLKLAGDRNDFPLVKLGRSGMLEAGQTVLAFGSPHGLERSVSVGIVSVPDRYLEDRGEMVSPYNNWIQTDAAINPGNSGGPLVNLKGEVIGVNARMLGGAENVGFAIPIDAAREVIDDIIAHGRVQRSWLGLAFQEMLRKTDDASLKGVVIADVDPLSPGAQAGLLPGDVMLSVNEIPTNARFVEDLPAVRKIIADLEVGSEASIRILRDNEEKAVSVVTVQESELKGDEVELEEWGFTVSDLTEAIVRRAQLPAKKGIIVSGTQVGGIAHNAGLERGDIILKVDDVEVQDLTGFKLIYKALLESKKPLVLLDVKRGALMRYVLAKQDGSTQSEGAADAEQGGAEDEQ